MALALLDSSVNRDDVERELDQLFEPTATRASSALGGIVAALETAASAQPRHKSELDRDPRAAFGSSSDGSLQLLLGFQPSLKDTLYPTWGNASISQASSELQALYALRLTAPVFGNNASQRTILTIVKQIEGPDLQSVAQESWTLASDERPDNVFLDNEYRSLEAGSYVLIRSEPDPLALQQIPREDGEDEDAIALALARLDAARRRRLLRATGVEVVQRSAYGLNGKSTRLDLDDDWRAVTVKGEQRAGDFSLRHPLVYTQSEPLALAEEPLTDPLCQAASIELDRLVDGLDVGRWLIVSGERSDLGAESGIVTSELCMLAGATQQGDSSLPGEKPHTTLSFAAPLSFCYKRGTISVWGNVAQATNGESRGEVLGAGDGAASNQRFALKQPPLTYVPAQTASGAASTLRVFVNEVEWHSTDSLADATPTDRVFLTRSDDDGKTSVIFGNGREGARLPTGTDNVRAEYRNGIGRGGNVHARQISTLVTRPLGLREVVNPLPATGGAERESRDQARRNAPLSVRALDRLVSVPDYADFSRRFAGIDKAYAVELSDGNRQVVHVTIAGVDDIPIAESSELFRNLRGALSELGDPLQAVELALRERLMLVLSARIAPSADYVWLDLSQRIRARLLEAFGFEQRELGQSVTSSEVLSVIQRVRGVDYVDLEVLDALSEAQVLALLEQGADAA
ncbi:MAG TPA: putative baseplate assembly protein, partial [Polyangiaceae bacterium]|nr:putative baseplate assembly protein [Polyangiaceae bacterium]